MKTSIFKKDGNLTLMHQNVINLILLNNKVYPCTWVGNGRHRSMRNISKYVIEVADYYGYKTTDGNDAPRKGAEGYFIKFSTQAQKSLALKFK
jgi:hypothetical protein